MKLFSRTPPFDPPILPPSPQFQPRPPPPPPYAGRPWGQEITGLGLGCGGWGGGLELPCWPEPPVEEPWTGLGASSKEGCFLLPKHLGALLEDIFRDGSLGCVIERLCLRVGVWACRCCIR